MVMSLKLYASIDWSEVWSARCTMMSSALSLSESLSLTLISLVTTGRAILDGRRSLDGCRSFCRRAAFTAVLVLVACGIGGFSVGVKKRKEIHIKVEIFLTKCLPDIYSMHVNCYNYTIILTYNNSKTKLKNTHLKRRRGLRACLTCVQYAPPPRL